MRPSNKKSLILVLLILLGLSFLVNSLKYDEPPAKKSFSKENSFATGPLTAESIVGGMIVSAKTPVPRLQKKASRSRVSVSLSEKFRRLRMCESHGNYATNTGNGFYGAYQFDRDTWRGQMGTLAEMAKGHLQRRLVALAKLTANFAPPWAQDLAARALQDRRGWSPWPGCSRKLGFY